MEFPSKLLEDLVYNISQLSGIGKRSALRIALEILRKPKEYSRDLSESIYDFKTQIKFCSQCHNISDKDVCDICLNPSRDKSLVCIIGKFCLHYKLTIYFRCINFVPASKVKFFFCV